MSISLENQNIETISSALRAGDFTATELAGVYLERIKEIDGNIGAYLEVYDDVMEQAKRADAMIAGGTATMLTGIPIAMKDNLLIKDRKVSAASKILEDYRAPYSATAAEKLAAEGVVFLGRANMDEFAMGGSTENSAYQVTKNPHDESRVPGGSSGGSAASVASNTSLFALGSDTGGSIRQPAAYSGLVGLKPTYGAVSRYGLMAMASSLDQIGPLTNTVTDAETVFKAIRGNDKMDSTSLSAEKFTEYEAREEKTKDKYIIGVPEEFLKEGVDEDVLSNFRESLQKLEDDGHEVREIALPSIDYALSTYYIIMPAEVSSNLARYDGIKYGQKSAGESVAEFYKNTRGEGFGKEVRRRVMLGTYVLSAGYYDAYYYKAVSVREKIKADYQKAFEEVDVIATPTSPTPAFKIGEKASDPLSMYAQDRFTVPANIAGLPAISLPSGFVNREGKDLPLGLHLTAPAFGEGELFTLGKKFLDEEEVS